MSLDPLKIALENLKPAGKDGFEGLLALALARITGNPMRLAASGFQFGVDGQGEDRLRPVCFEAKRYSSDLKRELVISKIADISRRKDEAEILWVLGATTEVRNQIAQDLRSDGEKQGIAVLVLDWNDQALPSLAITLANAGPDIAGWITGKTAGSSNEAELECILEHLRSEPDAQKRWKGLLEEFSAAELSGRQAVQANKSWLQATLSSQKKSRSRLGQPIAPRQQDIPVITRKTSRDAVISSLQAATTCIVLGTEGVGKSWVAAEAAVEFEGLSVILGAEKFEGIDDAQLESLLIREFAAQTENAHRNIARWQRRLAAWEFNAPSKGFLLVVDGVNQRPAVPWDRILTLLEGFVEDRGGKLLVTSRPQFFTRHVQRGFDRPQRLNIGNWSASERDQILNKVDIDPSSLDATTLQSLLNPRLLGIALSILPRDNPDAWKGLSVDALLFEHINRMQVDGFETQSPDELCLALSESAGQLLDTIRTGAGAGTDLVFEGELRAVKETRFFQSLPGPRGGYKLLGEGLSLALGFALVDRILQSVLDREELEATAAALIEPIAALDETSRVVLAALHICAFDPERYDAKVFECLVSAFCEMQNLDENAYPQFFDIVRQRPEATLSAARHKLLEWRNPINEKWLLEAVKQMSVSQDTRPAVNAAVLDWLRHINPDALNQQTKYGRADEKDEERAAKRQKEIDGAIASFSAHECKVFNSCVVVRGDTDSLLTQALELLAGLPLAPWASSLATLGFGFHLDHSVYQARKSFDQLTDFNRVDPVEAGQAFLEAAEPFRAENTSRAGKWSLVRMLYATGKEVHAKEAYVIGEGLRKDLELHRDFVSLREKICATDPCDPNSDRAANVDPTIQQFSEIDTDLLLTGMHRGSEDMDYEDRLCAVSRFGPEVAVAKGREFCQSILSREGMPLRQIALCATSLAPLLDRNDALALSKRLQEEHRLDTLPENDVGIVKHFMTKFAMHQLTGDEQLELLTSKSIAGNYSVDCIPSFKRPLEAAVIAALDAAEMTGDENAAFGALSLLAHTFEGLSTELEEKVALFITSENKLVRAAAFEVGLNTKNKFLRQHHLYGSWSASENTGSKGYENACGSALLIDAVVCGEAEFDDVLPRIAPESWYLAEHQIGNDISPAIIKIFDTRLRQAADQSGGFVPLPIKATIEPNDHVLHSFRSIDPSIPETTNNDKPSFFSGEETNEEFRTRQKRNHDLFIKMEEMLAEKDALIVAEQIDFDSFCRMLKNRRELGLQWAHLLQDLSSLQFYWFKDFAFMIAAATFDADENAAIRLFDRAIGAECFVQRMYPDGLSMEHKAVWSCPATPIMKALWRKRLEDCVSDDLLALEILAAERFGAKIFIIDLANELASSERPVDNALGITIAGFSSQFDHFEKILDHLDPSTGFVGRAMKAAKHAHVRARWAEHWIKEMWSARTPDDFWLNLTLASKVVDARSDYDEKIYHVDNRWHAFASLFTGARKDRIKKWGTKRAKTLYGNDTPNQVFLPTKPSQLSV
ncbi:hypothetical protein [uncultured Sulfitobacter sp.]|uniref:hypothetical protein n=1 Tax=uncultured Sulfitobacter sp. TaxID=191468 RepID=UPI002637627D|nr:hypothetical protein [uncultured Sulfitobacter sp.]